MCVYDYDTDRGRIIVVVNSSGDDLGEIRIWLPEDIHIPTRIIEINRNSKGLTEFKGVCNKDIFMFKDLKRLEMKAFDQLMLLLGGLALFPFILFLLYLIIKNRQKPLPDWFDEKQMSDMASGAMISVMILMPVLVVSMILSIAFFNSLPAQFWLLLVFFIALITFSGTVILKNRLSGA